MSTHMRSDLSKPSLREAAYAKAAEQEYGSKYVFWARTEESGCISVAQVLKIVETVRDEFREVKLEHVRRTHPEAAPGQYVVNMVDPVEPGEAHVRAAERAAVVRNVRVSLR